jgi:hypothetical protein
MNFTFVNKDGFLTYPSFDQTSSWTMELDSMSRSLTGGAVRVIMQLACIRDILTKSIRSSNPISVANATLDALRRIRNPEDVAKIRGKAKGAL